ncbi:MAG: carbon-nitrogen hydrolase family protein [Sandaracinus sp.]|nr:carbon-nitrogen hydrolase family protein [Sandaracinus sp.]MCB9631593.1 carbon-nitrogen hydrolase family protein [Sandaracinus sp.]
MTTARDERTRVGVVQLTSNDELERNLDAVERTVRGAANDGARLVVVPECFAYLGPERGKLALAESLPEGGPILARMAALARSVDVELVLGGFWETGPDADHVYNACVHVERDGRVGATYRKIHLFDVELSDGTTLRESDTVAPGETLVVADTVLGKLGLSVCYDLRFPELYRGLVDRGAIALTVPAAFTLHTGKDHWEVLLRARAIEAQSYVLAAAQTGHHRQADGSGRRMSWGHAMIVDPWGAVLAQCAEGEGWCVATVDPAYVAKVRASLPNLRHRRL